MTAGPKLEFTLQPGDIVAGLEPGELVEVQGIAPFGSKLLGEGIGASTRRQVRCLLSFEELGALTRSAAPPTASMAPPAEREVRERCHPFRGETRAHGQSRAAGRALEENSTGDFRGPGLRNGRDPDSEVISSQGGEVEACWSSVPCRRTCGGPEETLSRIGGAASGLV